MDGEDVPTNRLFSEGIVFSSHLFDEVANFSISWEDIDWDQPSDEPLHVHKALVTAATQFQYGNMSHLILCGNIIRNELGGATMDMQKLAIILSAYRIEGIELWGRYVSKMGGGATLSNELQRYYQHLFSEDETLDLLVGMEVLGGPLIHMIYDSLREQGDPVFNELVENLTQQKEKELELVAEFLQPIVVASEPETKRGLSRTVDHYSQIADKILATNRDTMKAFKFDPATMRNQVEMAVEEFRHDLGIPHN